MEEVKTVNGKIFIQGPLMTVPKPEEPPKKNTMKMIKHLSYPKKRNNVNSMITEERKKIEKDPKTEDVVRILNTGRYCEKVDWKSAFRQITINVNYLAYVGKYWFGMYFIDGRLHFGLVSNVWLFSVFSITFVWILIHEYSNIFSQEKT